MTVISRCDLFVCVCFFCHTKVFFYILTESNLSSFLLLQLDFESQRKLPYTQVTEEFIHVLFDSFILILRSLIHLQSIFLCDMKHEFNFIFFSKWLTI